MLRKEAPPIAYLGAAPPSCCWLGGLLASRAQQLELIGNSASYFYRRLAGHRPSSKSEKTD
jgi:hypothetical protein